MQIDVATSGIYTGDHMKRAPDGLGLYGSGGLYQQPYVDRYRKIRTPTPYELVAQFRNAVYVCCNLNGNAVAQCPRRLYVQTRKGEAKPKVRTRGLSRKQEEYIRGKASSSTVGRVQGDSNVEEVMDHPLLELLSKPNPFFDGMSLNKLTTNYLDIVGAAYWYIGERNKLGTPKEILPLPAQQVWPWRDKPDDDKVVDTWLFTSGRQQYRFPYKEVLQFHYFNPYEPYSVPYSPIHAVFEHVTVTEQALGHAEATFDNQARFDALVTPNDVIGEAEGTRLERKLNNKFRGAGMGSILVAESAMKIQPMQWSPIDLGSLELYAVTRDMIFDAYGVPQALATKETNLANLEASLTQHARQGIVPRLNTTDEAINRRLVPLYDDTGRLFVASDNPIKEDENENVKRMETWLKNGVATRSEARVQGGFEEAKWADVPLMPSNMNPVGPDGKPELPEPAGGMNGNNSKPSGNGANGNSGANQGAGRKPKKPKDGNGPKKSLVQDVARLAKAVAEGSLSSEAAGWALTKEHGLQSAEAEHYLSQVTDPATTQLKAALAFVHQPDMDDQTERRVADLWQQKSHDNIDWLAPDLDSKKNQNEIARACQTLNLGPAALTDLLKSGSLVDLKDKAWKRIQNSDSLKVARLRDVIEIAGRDKKKVKNLLGEFLEGRIRAPIVLGMPDGSYLINGNTRLCLAQVFKVRPKVWFARLPKPEKAAPEIDWRAKGLEAAFAKLAALPDMVPIPFVVGAEMPESGAQNYAPEKVLLRDLISIVPELPVADVRAALESAPEMAIIQASDGQRYIRHGLAGFVAAWLRGEEEVEAGVELAKDYDPAEPRVPAGSPGGGEWTSGDGGKPGNKPTNGKRATEEKPNAKVERSKAAHVMVDKDIQRYAEEYNEPRMAKLLGGISHPDSEPMDITAKNGDLVEMKTMVKNGNDKITMDSYSQIRKIVKEKDTGKTFHTIVSDDSKIYDASGKHDESKGRQYYYRRGVAGSARIGTMHKVKDEKELKALMAMPDDQLPDAAKRTDAKHRVGTWKPVTDESGRKGFHNKKLDVTYWAKK